MLNLTLLRVSHILSKLFLSGIIKAKPVAITIEPINVCNLKCAECPTGLGILQRKKGTLDLDNYQKYLSKLPNTVWYLNLYFQGEPFMHPDFIFFVNLAKQRSIVVSASTNGQFMTDSIAERTVQSGLDMLTISFDGTTQGVYEQYRIGGDFEKVVKTTRSLIAAKRKFNSRYPIITAQYLVFKHNEHQLGEFIKLANSLGVDKVDIKTAQIYESDLAHEKITSIEKYARYSISEDGGIKIKGVLKRGCWKAWSSMVVIWDGNVIPCCFDKDAKYILGNLNRHDFSFISYGNANKDFKNILLTKKSTIDICKNCPLSRK